MSSTVPQMKSISPRDCVVLFGIPVTLREYRDCVEHPNGRDLIANQGLTWPHYYRDIAGLAELFIPRWQGAGVHVATAATSESIRHAFSLRDFRVMILFAHSASNQIEMFDGMIPPEALAEQLPADFEGVSDLCVCNSIPLGQCIKQKRPHSLVKLVDAPVPFAMWFHLYTMLFNVLKPGTAGYVDTMDEVLSAWRPAGGWTR
jgi:hypothetical protein